MKLSVLAGSTSQSVNVFIQDSSSTTGAGLTGLAYNTSGLTAYYTFAGANAAATAITLATLAAVGSAWVSGGFKEIDSVKLPGVYRLDLPNAVLAAAKGRSVLVMLYGAASMAPCVLEIELTGWDNQDGVHGGMSALPNAAANANGGLPVLSSSGTTLAYTVSTVAGVTGNVGGNVTGSVGSVAGVTFPANFGDLAITVTTGRVTVGTNADKTGYALSVTPPTAAAIATAVLTSTAGGDLGTSGSLGYVVAHQLGGAFTTASSSVFTVAALANAPTGGSAPSAAEIADKVLGRNLAGGADGGRDVRRALRKLANKVSTTATPGYLTVFAEDDATPAYTQVLIVDATASLITSQG